MARIITQKKQDGKKPGEKDRSIRGLIYLLVFVILVLAVMVVVPLLQARESKAESYACTLSIRRAQDAVLLEFYSDPEASLKEAAVAVDESKLAQDQLCPSGGDFYLIPEGGSWHVTCGLHEENTYLRTRLNATYVFEQLQQQLESYRRLEMNLNTNLLINVNGKALDIIQVPGDNGLRRGTDYSIDFDGVVCFYSLNSSGQVNWFVYADANHAAVWKIADGWSGDAYSKT